MPRDGPWRKSGVRRRDASHGSLQIEASHAARMYDSGRHESPEHDKQQSIQPAYALARSNPASLISTLLSALHAWLGLGRNIDCQVTAHANDIHWLRPCSRSGRPPIVGVLVRPLDLWPKHAMNVPHQRFVHGLR